MQNFERFIVPPKRVLECITQCREFLFLYQNPLIQDAILTLNIISMLLVQLVAYSSSYCCVILAKWHLLPAWWLIMLERSYELLFEYLREIEIVLKSMMPTPKAKLLSITRSPNFLEQRETFPTYQCESDWRQLECRSRLLFQKKKKVSFSWVIILNEEGIRYFL